MSSAATVMSRLLALAFFLVIGLGVFAFIQNSEMQAAEQKVADANQQRADLQLRVAALEKSNAAFQRDLQACQSGGEAAE